MSTSWYRDRFGKADVCSGWCRSTATAGTIDSCCRYADSSTNNCLDERTGEVTFIDIGKVEWRNFRELHYRVL